MTHASDNRLILMKRIQMYAFVLVEANLFLDTHPCDQEGIKYFNKHKKLYDDSVADFTRQFGPISLQNYQPDTKWSWVNEPWPWEMEA